MKCGVQLFTLRGSIKDEKGMAATFASLSKLGVHAVQLSGAGDVEPKTIRRLADDNGLIIPATHTAFERIKNQIDAVAEEHSVLGAKTVGLGSMPLKYRNVDAVGEFVDFCNATTDALKKYGLTFAYHNHNFEYKKLPDGTRLIDRLIDGAKDLEFILDTYWVNFAKASNEEYIKKLENRLRNVHLKDSKRRFFGLFPIMCEIGSGELDFAALLPLFEQAGTEYAYIEQDISKNPLLSVEKSVKYLKDVLHCEF